MKIELTPLQLEKLIEAARISFTQTHNATFLGLQHNLEFQRDEQIGKKLKTKTQIILFGS